MVSQVTTVDRLAHQQWKLYAFVIIVLPINYKKVKTGIITYLNLYESMA
jgi:hypothetical protein